MKIKFVFPIIVLFIGSGCRETIGLCDPDFVYEGIEFETVKLSDGTENFLRLKANLGGSSSAAGIIEQRRTENELTILVHNTCETRPYRQTSIDILVKIDSDLHRIKNGREAEIVWATD